MTYSKQEIESKAEEVRKLGCQSAYGMDNIFNLLHVLKIDYVRYPFTDEKPLGFSTRFKGRNIIVSNSSLILSRELFTIAHELGHIVFDFNDEDKIMIDVEDFTDTEKDKIERRAYYFAECLLMPEEGLRKYIKFELETVSDILSVFDIVRMQNAFKTSYTALVWRLLKIGLIKDTHKDQLLDDQKKMTSELIFDLLGFEKDLLRSYGRIQVPEKYIKYIINNYKDKIIPRSSFEKAISLLGVSKDVISGLTEPSLSELDT